MPDSDPMLLVLATLLAVASASDVALHRIANSLVIAVAATGLLSALLVGGAVALGEGALASVVTAAVIWPAWAKEWIGGGDLKLAAATAAWLGIGHVPTYLLTSAIAVGIVSMVCYAASAPAVRSDVRGNLAMLARGAGFSAPLRNDRGRVQVPAGVGFAVGALVTLAMRGGL
jgi:prepilin peptidase CpaA